MDNKELTEKRNKILKRAKKVEEELIEMYRLRPHRPTNRIAS